MDAMITRAIAEAGGIKKLADGLGITHPAIYSWSKIPAGRVVAVEKITGIPRSELRPDLFIGMEPAE